jgi:hypothetical protein
VGLSSVFSAAANCVKSKQRLGHSRPDILLEHYTHVLDESSEFAASMLSAKLSGKAKKANPKKA